MLRYALRRLLYAVFVVYGVLTLVFVIMRLLPGDPAYVLAGPTATQADVDTVRHSLGIDRPIYVQYAIFLRQLATGDLGHSVYYHNVPAARPGPGTDARHARTDVPSARARAALRVRVWGDRSAASRHVG